VQVEWQQKRPRRAGATSPLPADLSATVTRHISRPELSGIHPMSSAAPSASFCTDLADLLHARVAAFATARKECGLPASATGDNFLEYICSLQAPTAAQVEKFVGAAVEQYTRKLSEASTPLGAIAAQVCPLELLHWTSARPSPSSRNRRLPLCEPSCESTTQATCKAVLLAWQRHGSQARVECRASASQALR
jgi:hypothetical protein